MISCENKVITEVTNALAVSFPSAEVSGEYTEVPESFPYVSIAEEDNTIARDMSTLDSMETAVDVMFAVNVYSNLVTGRKSQAKSIASEVDRVMVKMGFSRSMMQNIPNEDLTIYRIALRYEGRVTQTTEGNTTIYTVYGQ